jgi:hypothetical protein
VASTLHELSREGVLLLYLADELGAEDRAEVEQRLLRDPALRAELDGLRGTQELLHTRLALLDAATPLAAEEEAGVRNVSRMMRQRLARPQPAPALEPAIAVRRLPRWAYPAAAVAAVALIAGVTWRSLGPGSGPREVADTGTQEVQLDPWENHAVSMLTREVGDAPPGDGFEVASIGYDQPLFDIPLDAPQEGGQAQP